MGKALCLQSRQDQAVIFLSLHKCIIIYFGPIFCRKIKVWDLQAALDPRAPASSLCLRTLVVILYSSPPSSKYFNNSEGYSEVKIFIESSNHWNFWV
jgi:hypothetical protein